MTKSARLPAMKRRLLASLAVALIAICTISAAPVEFVFGGLDQHAEVLGGFLPSFLKAGAGYNGFSLIDLKLTVPTEKEAETIARSWSLKNQEIYASLLAELL